MRLRGYGLAGGRGGCWAGGRGGSWLAALGGWRGWLAGGTWAGPVPSRAEIKLSGRMGARWAFAGLVGWVAGGPAGEAGAEYTA